MKLFPPAVFGFMLPATSLRGRFVSVANSRCGDLTGLSGLLSLIALCFGAFVHQANGAASSTYPYTVRVIPGLPPVQHRIPAASDQCWGRAPLDSDRPEAVAASNPSARFRDMAQLRKFCP